MEIINESESKALEKAKFAILDGEVICFKSDTVYGFACDSRSEKAVDKIYKLKKRGAKKPIAIFVNEVEMAQKIFEFSKVTSEFCVNYMPGFVTLVTKVKEGAGFTLAKNLNLESNFIGFRIIESNFVNSLISSLDFPLAVTSANISGSKELLSVNEVVGSFANNGDDDFLLIDGGESSSIGVSTVVKIDNEEVEILRQGVAKIK